MLSSPSFVLLKGEETGIGSSWNTIYGINNTRGNKGETSALCDIKIQGRAVNGKRVEKQLL